MSTRKNDVSQAQKLKVSRGEGANWVLIAGGALLSTLSISLGCKLKELLDSRKQAKVTSTAKENGKTNGWRKSPHCCLHSNASSYTLNSDCCFNFIPETEGMESPNQQLVADPSDALPLVTVPPPEFNKANGGIWSSSYPDRLELPPKPSHHHSTCSDSPCVSESGSDIFSKREVIQKLRQQLKRRDDMILEMQDQIQELQNSVNAQMAHSSHLQGQINSANRDLFDSDTEIQRLRMTIADQCVGHMVSNGKPSQLNSWNGHSNGSINEDTNHRFSEKERVCGETIEMLKKEVGVLKEVIEGKEYLVKSYKEQKTELASKIKELQQRVDSQVPNIL